MFHFDFLNSFGGGAQIVFELFFNCIIFGGSYLAIIFALAGLIWIKKWITEIEPKSYYPISVMLNKLYWKYPVYRDEEINYWVHKKEQIKMSKYTLGKDKFTYDNTKGDCILISLLIVTLLPVAIWIAVTFLYYVLLIITCVCLAHLARFCFRLKRKIVEHIKDMKLHKKEIINHD